MPMYYPDLKSVRNTAEAMAKNTGAKKYKGIIPKTEKELPEARIQLGRYFRSVWGDEVAAVEVEMSVTKENYNKKLSEGLFGGRI
jgi:hypothetical protein